MVLSESRLRELLEPFSLGLAASQSRQLINYLELLSRWNQRINLTAIRSAEECVTRHFGESLFIRRWMTLEGSLLDAGSGAGFPGLALKIVFPDLSVTLLEPVAKKRAFLKEAARECNFKLVDVRGERLKDFVRIKPSATFDSLTSRGVGHLDRLLPDFKKCLREGGRLILWLTSRQAEPLKNSAELKWASPISIPLSRNGEIWHATKLTGSRLSTTMAT